MDGRSAMNLKSSDRLKQEIDNEQMFNFVQVSIDCMRITFFLVTTTG